MSFVGQSKVYYANLDDDNSQRNVKQSEIDEFAKHSGKKTPGYLPKNWMGEVNRMEEDEAILRRMEEKKERKEKKRGEGVLGELE
ncbi:hypothetical protein B0H67DRAFT_648103 [Lasiosphaeris hirsuta]|uniref:Uncharacterized protein n=1 Tax=Lasiosphaeris hirsuta TaxID=260670 RepID=A0AA40A2B9_9PEZI|nr:hypothetical protein B0H67DRAFT_648103 [Lasiosphaeris hirsuta]